MDERGLGVARFTALITALMAVGTFSQYTLGALGPLLVDDFALSRTQFGALTTALFVVAAALSPVLGPLADRVSARTTYSMLFLAAAVSLGGIALAPAFLPLLLFVCLGGVGQALVNPVSNKLVAEHIPPGRQGLVMGIKQSGVQLAAVTAGLAMPWLAVAAGWRVAVGSVAVLVAVGWLATARRVPQQPLPHEMVTTISPGVPRAVLALTAYGFLMGGAIAVVGAYLPLYGHEVVGLSAAVAGTLVAAIGAVGAVSRVALGHLIDRIGNVTAILNLLTAVTAIAVALILVAEVGGPAFAWAGALVIGGSVGWNAVAMIALVRKVGRAATGRASGYVMVGFFGGFIVAPVAFGAGVDLTGAYTLPWATVAAGLAAAALGMWLWRRLLRS